MNASGWCLAVTGAALVVLSLFTVRVRAESVADGRQLVALADEERILQRRRDHALVEYTRVRHVIGAHSPRARSVPDDHAAERPDRPDRPFARTSAGSALRP